MQTFPAAGKWKLRAVDVQQASGGTCRTREMTSRPRAPGWTGGQCGPGERAGRDRHRRLAPCVCKRQQRSDGPGRRQERKVPTRGKAEGVSPSQRRTPFAARSRPVGTLPTTRAAGRTDTRARGVVQPAGTAATWVSQPTCTGHRAAPRARPLMRVCGASVPGQFWHTHGRTGVLWPVDGAPSSRLPTHGPRAECVPRGTCGGRRGRSVSFLVHATLFLSCSFQSVPAFSAG